jgi:hypothetical protein
LLGEAAKLRDSSAGAAAQLRVLAEIEVLILLLAGWLAVSPVALYEKAGACGLCMRGLPF